MVRSNPLKCLHLTLSLLGILFLTCHSQTQSIRDLLVTIPQGTLQGRIWTTLHGRNISAFERIPYAQPPIGNLRFANPVAAHGWRGILNATSVGKPCIQMAMVGCLIKGEEDCLFLHVYTPRLPENANSSLLPVMVFIHGGGFQLGGSTLDSYDPHFLLDQDVLLVLMNYRLGALGFLSTGDEVASGNWGLKDVVLALKWVQSNIKYFGGDPDKVTLFGGSSGSIMVHLLTLSDATIGLFHKFITQSGSALSTGAHRPRAMCVKRAYELGRNLGCFNDSSDALINCLKTSDASDILTTNQKFLLWHAQPWILWGPTDEPDIKGAVLTDSPANLFAAGKIRDVPCITGVTRDEGLSISLEFHTNEEILYEFLANFDYLLPVLVSWTYQPDSGASWVQAVKSYYLDNDLKKNSSVLLSQLTFLLGDAQFIYPCYSALQKQLALSTNPQYFYSFNYEGTVGSTFAYSGSRQKYGVTHGDELNYLFPRDDFFAGKRGNLSKSDSKMVDIMVQLWTSFATNGTPTISNLNISTIWTPYSSEDNYLRIGNGSDLTLEMEYSFLPERMQFWANLEATLPIAADQRIQCP